jgi:hypothetical protein
VLLLVWLELGKRTATVRFSDAGFLRAQQGFSRWLRFIVLALNAAALVLAVWRSRARSTAACSRRSSRTGWTSCSARRLRVDVGRGTSGPTGSRRPSSAPRSSSPGAPATGSAWVVFGNGAMTLCPLTLDREVLNAVIDRLRIGTLDGTRTAIGMGLADAVARLHKSSAREKVVILLTDGVNNAGEVEPLTAARLAQTYADQGVLHRRGLAGAGHGDGERPVLGPTAADRPGGLRLEDAREHLGAHRRPGVRRGRRRGAEAHLRQDQPHEPTQFKATHHTVYSEKAGQFLLPAALLFLTGALVPAVLWRRLP